MKGFIVYPTYRTIDNKSYIYLFGRLENGESFLTVSLFKPYFYIRSSHLEKAKKLAKFDYENTDLLNFDKETMTKIIIDNTQEQSYLRSRFLDENIGCFEADIRLVMRFLMDNEIKASMNIEGDFKKDQFVDRVYQNPKLEGIDWVPKLKILSFDIETSMDAKQIFSISLYTGDYSNVLIVSKNKNLKGADSLNNEKELLMAFKQKVSELDPDIITGWNLVDFDLDILQKKFQEHKIPFTLGRSDWNCAIRRQESFFKDSTANIPGRIVLDGIMLMKISFIKLPDYKLDTAAKVLIGDQKTIGHENKGTEIQDAFDNDPQKLADYNLKDSILVYDILKKTGVIDLTIKRSMLTGVQLDKVKGSIVSFDSLYLRELKQKGYVGPSANFGDREERIKGGFVMSSKPGIYDYIIVCDFKSLYPSIMRTFNIDPFTYVKNPKEGEDLIKAPNGAHFRKEKGILTDMLTRLWKARDERKKDNDKIGSSAIKVLMNSMFGVLANPVFRFHSIAIANAITYFGQHLIKLTAEKVEEKGYEVIYGDTDSIFINLKVESKEEAFKLGKKIQDEMNVFFDKHIKDTYGIDSFLELEFEKTYRRFLMPKARGSDEGSKKRYAGLKIESDGSEKMDFVGLEFVRRDWTKLAKKFQLTLIQKVFNKEEVGDFVKEFVKDLKNGKLDDLLVYRKAIRKDLASYTKTTPPHVKAARMLPKITSNIIDYYMTINGPEPIQLHKSRIDYDHYIEKQVKPLADGVLFFYNENFDDIIKGASQKTLFGF